MLNHKLIRNFLVIAALAVSPQSLAATVLTFEAFGDSSSSIGDFFNGGTNSSGVTGPDLGIEFTGAFGFTQGGVSVMTWENESSASFTAEDGFEGGLAIRAWAPELDLTITILDAAGDVLANQTFFLDGAISDGNVVFQDLGIAFDGVAAAVMLTDEAVVNLSFLTAVENITLGQTTVVPVPAAFWLFLSGLGFLAHRGRRTV